MKRSWISALIPCLFLLLAASCKPSNQIDGAAVEQQILTTYNLTKETDLDGDFVHDIESINCLVDSPYLHKRIVLANEYSSSDTNKILLIPFRSNGITFNSAAYSDIKGRYILVNPAYIHTYYVKLQGSDSLSYEPLLEVMLLHEVAHFIMGRPGAFDKIDKNNKGLTFDDLHPESINEDKITELKADSIAMAISARRNDKAEKIKCHDAGLLPELVVSELSLDIDVMKKKQCPHKVESNFLHRPSTDHPNIELRLTCMEYFSTDLPSHYSIKDFIDDYLGNGVMTRGQPDSAYIRLNNAYQRKFKKWLRSHPAKVKSNRIADDEQRYWAYESHQDSLRKLDSAKKIKLQTSKKY